MVFAEAFLVEWLQALDARQGLDENAEGIVGYAAKVGLTTALGCGETRPWPPDAIADYVAATMRCSRGRQGFKLSVRPVRPAQAEQKPTEEWRPDYLEPMPILF